VEARVAGTSTTEAAAAAAAAAKVKEQGSKWSKE
jgi:hypothetical protein